MHMRNNFLSVLGSHLSTNTNKEVYKGQFRKYLEFCSVMVSVKSRVKNYYGRTENRKKRCHCVPYIYLGYMSIA